MIDSCVCYVTDPGYVIPTLVSAVQARQNTSRDVADVMVLGVDLKPEFRELVARICAAKDIMFVPVEGRALDGATAMLGRLFLTKLVPPHYQHFLYIDGDTQVTGSLDPLIGFPVPSGKFLAAVDPMAFALAGRGKTDRDSLAHLQKVGLSAAEGERYFNSGVIRMDRDAWEGVERTALQIFDQSTDKLSFPDQDALNKAGRGQNLPMSLAWNFPIFMRNARVEKQVKPRITHFMSQPKPWDGVFCPWNASATRPYRQLVAEYPALAEYLTPVSGGKRLRYKLQQAAKWVIETVTWGRGPKRAMILDYERKVILAGSV